MIDHLEVLALIPARANSKGLPGKNTRNLAGKPLIAWSIEAANRSQLVDMTVVSTDSIKTAKLAKSLGANVPFIRPAELALDDTPGIDPVLHATQMIPGYDILVVLQPTSPLRTTQDIDAAIQYLQESEADFCISVTRSKIHPNWLYSKNSDGFLSRYEDDSQETHRQSLTSLYAPNGAIYIARTEKLLEHESMLGPRTVAYEMSDVTSWDIDTLFDFRLCEWLLAGDIQKAA